MQKIDVNTHTRAHINKHTKRHIKDEIAREPSELRRRLSTVISHSQIQR